MSIFKAALGAFVSRRGRVFDKYDQIAPAASQPPQQRLVFHVGKLVEYATMYSEAAFVAGKQSLSFTSLRDNDMFFAIEAAARALKEGGDESGVFLNHPGVEQLIDAVLNIVHVIKTGEKSSTTTARTLDLLCVAAAFLRQALAPQLTQDVQVPRRVADLVSQLRVPEMQAQQATLANLARVLADDAKAMMGELKS